jgi:hypothetical protein
MERYVGLWAIRLWKGLGISMTIQLGNLFADVADVSAANIGEEAFSEILAQPGLKIERIISQGQTRVQTQLSQYATRAAR